MAEIAAIILPRELYKDQYITGRISVSGVGKIAATIKTLWNNKVYGAAALLPQKKTVSFIVPSGLIKMPGMEARLEVTAGILQDGWSKYKREDIRTWTVSLKTPEVDPLTRIGQLTAASFPIISILGAITLNELEVVK